MVYFGWVSEVKEGKGQARKIEDWRWKNIGSGEKEVK